MLTSIYSTAASSGDFPVLMSSSFTNLSRPWYLLLVWQASVKPGSFKEVLYSMLVSWSSTILTLVVEIMRSRTSIACGPRY